MSDAPGIRRFISDNPLEIPAADAKKPMPSVDTIGCEVKKVSGAISPFVKDAIEDASADGRVTATEVRQSILPAMKKDPALLSCWPGGVDTFDAAAMRDLLARAQGGKIRMDDTAQYALQREIDKYESKLADGKVRTGCFVKDGLAHQKGVCDAKGVTTNELFAKMPPETWSPNLAVFQRGEVRELSRRELPHGGYEIVQHERMLLGRGLTDMDMTKVSTITVEVDPETGLRSATVRWNVYRSDATEETGKDDTMKTDVGYIRFEPTPDQTGTRISFLNATKSGTQLESKIRWLGRKTIDRLAAVTAADIGGKVVEGYRKIAYGDVEAVRFDD